jgi:hypothetical protein
MEPEGSLQCSQVPTTGPYPQPDESNQHPPTLFLMSMYINISVTFVLMNLKR